MFGKKSKKIKELENELQLYKSLYAIVTQDIKEIDKKKDKNKESVNMFNYYFALYSLIFISVLLIIVLADSRTSWKSKIVNICLFLPVLISLVKIT